MNVSLTPELEAMVEEQVRSGEYRSASEVVRDALRLFQRRNEEYEARLAALRSGIQEAIDQFDTGLSLEGPHAMAQARADLHRRTAL